ncbi:MAG: hypothetical protein DIU78_008835 [Pseudomonadota bacterium]
MTPPSSPARTPLPPPSPPGLALAEPAGPPAPFVPRVLPYRDGDPVPPGYRVETRPATGLLLTGGITLAAGYLVGLGVAQNHRFAGSMGWMAVPLVGPWGAIGGRTFQCEITGTKVSSIDDFDDVRTAEQAEACVRRAQREATTVAALAVDGMLQAIGAVVFVAGLASSTKELVWTGATGLRISARPRSGGFDLGVTGEF